MSERLKLADRLLYLGELATTAAFLLAVVIVGIVVGWYAALAVVAAFVMGTCFTTLSHARRDVRLTMNVTLAVTESSQDVLD